MGIHGHNDVRIARRNTGSVSPIASAKVWTTPESRLMAKQALERGQLSEQLLLRFPSRAGDEAFVGYYGRILTRFRNLQHSSSRAVRQSFNPNSVYRQEFLLADGSSRILQMTHGMTDLKPIMELILIDGESDEYLATLEFRKNGWGGESYISKDTVALELLGRYVSSLD